MSAKRGRVARGGRAARIVARSAYRSDCPGPAVRPVRSKELVDDIDEHGRAVRYRTSYHVWAIVNGLRHKTFQLRARYSETRR